MLFFLCCRHCFRLFFLKGIIRSCLLVGVFCFYHDACAGEGLFSSVSVSPKYIRMYALNHVLPSVALAALGKPGQGILLKGEVVRALFPRRILWVEASKATQKRVAQLLSVVDAVQRQWMIRADIVNVDKRYWRDLGSAVLMSGAKPSEVLPNDAAWVASEGASDSGHALHLILGRIGQKAFQWKVDALVRSGHAQRVASPVLVARNNEEALIESGEEVPYQEKTGQGNTSVAFKKAVISLQVRPRMLSQHDVLLDLTVKQDQLSALRVNGVPAIQTERLHTVASLREGQALLLGGITQKEEGEEEEGVPFLRRIPIVGWFFRHKVHIKQKRYLLILLAPQWVR